MTTIFGDKQKTGDNVTDRQCTNGLTDFTSGKQ